MTSTTAVNYAIYQAGWLACIFGAAWDLEAAGVAIAITLIVAHLWMTRERGLECRLIAITTVAGYVIEATQIALATYEARSTLMPAGMPPAWLLVLWAQFATTFRYCLGGIVRAPLRAAVFGGVGGPVAFLAADRLGALDLLAPIGPGLTRTAILWTAALLVLHVVVRRSSPPEHEPSYRQTFRGL